MYKHRLSAGKYLEHTSKVEDYDDLYEVASEWWSRNFSETMYRSEIHESGDEEFHDVCVADDQSRIKRGSSNDKLPNLLMHATRGTTECRHNGKAYCFYAWYDSPFVYVAEHTIGQCPKSEYRSELETNYNFDVTLSFNLRFRTFDKVTKKEVSEFMKEIFDDIPDEAMYDYLEDYVDIEDRHSDIDTGRLQVKVE